MEEITSCRIRRSLVENVPDSHYLFRRNRALIVERGPHRMPREAGAFDARRKLAYAGEDRQTSQVMRLRLFVKLTRHHPMKLIEEHLGLLFTLPLDALRHHARRCFRDGATTALKTDGFPGFIFNLHVDHQLVAAQRVEAFGSAVSRLQLMKVARLLVVIENDLLV